MKLHRMQYGAERMCEEVKGHQEHMVKSNKHLAESTRMMIQRMVMDDI